MHEGDIQPHSKVVKALPLHQRQAVAPQLRQNQMPVGLDIKGQVRVIYILKT